MFPKPLIFAQSLNEFELGLFCNTLSVYHENVFGSTPSLSYDLHKCT